MPLVLHLPFVAAALAALLAIAGLVRKRPSPAAWCFFAGMVTLALDSVCAGLGLRAASAGEVDSWFTRGLVLKSFLPVVWLGFSLTYSRGNYREFLARWRLPLALVGLLPLVLWFGFRDGLLHALPAEAPATGWWLRSSLPATLVNIALVGSLALVLTNLEQTFRSAVGTQRWRIKFVIVGLAVVFGAHLYVRSQAILFSVHDTALSGVESSALLVGCLFLALAYARTGLAEIDVYPSLAVLRSSLTVLILGAYLFIVGVLAEVARYLGGAGSFQFQALIVLLGMAGLAVLLLSDRLRQRVHRFAVRHFRHAQHDAARIWTTFSLRLANVKDQAGLCAVSARLLSESFDVLSPNVWLLDEGEQALRLGASVARQPGEAAGANPPDTASGAVVAGLQARTSAFDLEEVDEAWAGELRQLNPSQFPNGGHRWCVPLRAGDKLLGALVLADRVSAAAYTPEDLELLKCIGDQLTSVLLNLRLANEVARARELEAFRTMSAFFVHDLKNTAASLNLMLNNLPVHFDDPDFREDALRSVGNTARRIEEMIVRLGALRQRPDFTPADVDLSQLAGEALDRLELAPGVELVRDLRAVPPVLADREQIRSVVTNLVLNARDAIDGAGRILVRTEQAGARVVLSVADDGCGMSPAFVKDSLFRPFQSTKKKGLGIGMFHARTIVEQHGGSIQVESEVGKGTTFRVSFPAREQA